ncbi:MAG: hypothetical protein M0P66_00070 [Salinivirgaceae bacterium]|nr:hypothetical protein [Salinivirgaceae bacterium]
MPTPSLKTAVFLTGAAARISQEVALLDQLMAQKGLTLSQDQTLLAGFSSGSLNLAAINACFSKGSKLGWDKYYKQSVLFPLRNSQVYKVKLLPFDTNPLRDTVTTFVKNMDCQWMGDLPFHSYILTFSWKEMETLWACSRDDNQKAINLVDMFMASTAIPVLFPSQEIHCQPGKTSNFPDGRFADGGTGGTFKQFEHYLGTYVAANGPFDKLYIISPMREKADKESRLMKAFLKAEHKGGIDFAKLDDHLGNISLNTFLKFCERLNNWSFNGKPMANEIYVSIPQMKRNFNILNFNRQQKQYETVGQWIKDHPEKLAIPIQEYLDEHKEELA